MTERLRHKFELWLKLHGWKILPEQISCEYICKYANTCKRTEEEREPYNYKYPEGIANSTVTCIRWLDSGGEDE